MADQVFGARIPMPPQTQLSDEDRKTLVVWVLSGGK
jgi:cytochrome c